jgi:predicted alpha/beta-fold hydrolase
MITSSQFKPACWLPGTHAQTLWPSLIRRPVGIELTTERLTLPDSDFIDLAWTKGNSDKIVIVLHGLEGSIDSSYARGMLAAIHKKGWRGVFMHFRGCSGEHNLMDRSYHSGETGDLRFLVETLRKRHPDATLVAVGYSLGGNALLKYLGEYKDDSQLKAATAVSVSYLLSNSATKLEKGFSRLYQRHLLNRLMDKTLSKFQDRQAPVDIANINKLNTFKSFDHHITAPIHGFKSGDDYYEQSSSRQYLYKITTPTLLIHSRDDPFMSVDAIPNQDDLSESVTLELSNYGGHVGFVSGNTPWNAIYWLEERIPEFLSTYLD